jgi:polyhydroxyalkanoate synthesis regulator protein
MVNDNDGMRVKGAKTIDQIGDVMVQVIWDGRERKEGQTILVIGFNLPRADQT